MTLIIRLAGVVISNSEQGGEVSRAWWLGALQSEVRIGAKQQPIITRQS
jgi:hypothetical protein